MPKAYIIPYPLANLGEKEEEVEQKRLDDMQFAFCELLGKNVFAPLSSPQNILDVGTGSGAWCVEVARQLPDGNVTGLDLSSIQRQDAPANCHFIVGNLLEGLKFENDCFDFVHSRYLQLLSIAFLIKRLIRASVPKDQWPVYLKEVYRILKPGTGWIQCGEFEADARCDDGSCPEDAPLFTVNETSFPGLLSVSETVLEEESRQQPVYQRRVPRGSVDGCWFRRHTSPPCEVISWHMGTW